MTSQTYHTDDYPLVHEHDQVVPVSDPMAPDTDLAEPTADPMAPDTDLAEPTADPMAPDTDLAEPDAELTVAEPDPAELDADQTGHEDPTSHPALADPESAASTMPDYPGLTPDGDEGPAETAMADSSPESPSLVSVAFTVPESVTGSQLAGNTASAHGPWNDIQAMFVDDPRASIERAAGLVDDRVEALVRSVRDRQRSMRTPWQASDAGTEELRVALQHYRTFWNGLEDLPE